MRGTFLDRHAPAALLAAGALLWASSFAGRFQFDDFGAVVPSGRLDAAPPALSTALAAIRPLTALTFRAEHRLFGFDPTGYHLLSVVVHLASCLLVGRIVRRLLEPRRSDAPAVAFLTALLFLVHPLATEAVTYLSGRASLLAACLSLLAVERWQSWRARERTADRERPPAVAWGSLAAFALALCAKETAAIVPLALALVDAAAPARVAGAERQVPVATRLRPYLPHLLLLALFLALAASHPVYRRLLAHSLALRAPAENLLLLPAVAVEGATLFVAPGRLNLDHDLRAATTLGAVAPLLAAVAGAAVAALVALRRRPPAGFGLLWYLLHLLPTASLVARNDLLSERNLYLPAVGLCLLSATLGVDLATALGARLPGRLRPAAGAVALALAAATVLALAAATVRRNALYADPVALWADAVRKSPAKARPHANLAWSLELAGERDTAREE